MRQIVPGVYHWTTFHERIELPVSSYYVTGANVLIDPMAPDDGLDWFRFQGPPELVLLTNAHHMRAAVAFARRFGSRILCHEDAVEGFRLGEPVHGFAPGDSLANGAAVIHEVAAVSASEVAIHLPAHGALAVGDGIFRNENDEPRFLTDDRLGDDPQATKGALRDAYTRLLALEFDVLLLAHGNPFRSGGKDALRRFLGIAVPDDGADAADAAKLGAESPRSSTG